MNFEEILNAVSGIVKTGINVATPIMDFVTAERNRKAQEEENRENREWQETQNRITRRREDTAHQREVADLQAAGLSPLASTNGSPVSQPIGSELEAPQMDMTAFTDAMATLAQGLQENEALNLEKRKIRDQETQWQKEQNSELEKWEDEKSQWEKNFELTKQIEDEKARIEIEKVNAELENQYDQIEIEIENGLNQDLQAKSEASEEAHRNFCEAIGGYVPGREYDKYEEYLGAYKNFMTLWNDFIQWCSQDRQNRQVKPTYKGGGGGAAAGPVSVNASQEWEQNNTNQVINTLQLLNYWIKNIKKGSPGDFHFPIFTNKMENKKHATKRSVTAHKKYN